MEGIHLHAAYPALVHLLPFDVDEFREEAATIDYAAHPGPDLALEKEIVLILHVADVIVGEAAVEIAEIIVKAARYAVVVDSDI